MQPVQPTTPRHSPSPWTNDGERTEPTTPESPTLRLHGLRREPAMILTRYIYQYNRPTNSLRPWYWPINEGGIRIKPSDLLEYRMLYDFRAPSCLCASSPALNADTAHTEAAIFVSSGEYVAACASGNCRYWVSIERMYKEGGLLVRRYPLRFAGSTVPALPNMPNSQANGGHGGTRMQEIEADLGENLCLISRSPGPHRSSLATAPSTPVHGPLVADTQPNHEDVDALLIATVKPLAISEFTLFLRLDSFTKPGVSKAQFLALFARCLGCGKYMTRRTVTFHDCENVVQGRPLATAPSTPAHGPLVADTQPNHEDVDALLIPTVKPLATSEYALFLQLDSFTKPGVSKAQFLALFARCLGCGKYMTRRTVTFHDCENFGDEIGFGENVVIDLTGDD